MERAWAFLLGLSSGEVKLDRHLAVRAEAREIVKHFPLGGDLASAARRYAPELLGKVEREADQLTQQVGREAAARMKAERAAPVMQLDDSLNVP